jgi:hypothetical protein
MQENEFLNRSALEYTSSNPLLRHALHFVFEVGLAIPLSELNTVPDAIAPVFSYQKKDSQKRWVFFLRFKERFTFAYWQELADVYESKGLVNFSMLWCDVRPEEPGAYQKLSHWSAYVRESLLLPLTEPKHFIKLQIRQMRQIIAKDG